MELRTGMEKGLFEAFGEPGVNFWRWLHRPRTPSVPEPADMRAAVEARHAATSKNIVNRPGPEAKYPSRPASSPFDDQMARQVFDVDQLVPEPPSTEQLRTAIQSARESNQWLR